MALPSSTVLGELWYKLNAIAYFKKRGEAVRYVPPCFPVLVEITSKTSIMVCISKHLGGILNLHSNTLVTTLTLLIVKFSSENAKI